MSTLEERALADSDDSDRFEFAGTQRDTLTSFIKTSGALVKMTAERDEARANLARLAADMAESPHLTAKYWRERQSLRDEVAVLTRVIQGHDRECQGFKAAIAQRDATIERVSALLGDRDGPLRAVRGVREADIRAALEGKP